MGDDLWLNNPSWEEYEAYVFGSLERLLPGASVRKNVRVLGIKTGRPRQIDVIVERDLSGFRLTIAVDCKCYKQKVDVNDVERFLGMLDDIRVSKGVLMTTNGYTETALKRAKNESRDIELRILTTERLSEFQNIGCAIPWKGTVAAVVSPPEAWVVDNETTPNRIVKSQFMMYPLGHTRDSAFQCGAFIYGNIILKSENEPTMEAIASRHERDVVKNVASVTFERLPSIERESTGGRRPEQTILRIGHIPKYNGPEYSLYIDHPKGVLVLVLLCPDGQDDNYLPLLKWVGLKVLMLDCREETAPTRRILLSRPAES